MMKLFGMVLALTMMASAAVYACTCCDTPTCTCPCCHHVQK
ncbi:MAG TPA: hypothetical protein VMT15_01255 [Bryobacteraceae bacterium]|nr:hypothetical protein [Bryobacteraceae bacterium]